MEVLGTPAGPEVKTDNPQGSTDANADPNSTAEKQTGDWYTSLPQEMQESPSIQKFKGKTVEDVLTSYGHLEKKIGEKGLIIPKEDAPQEEKDAFQMALGRPETAEGYELAYPEGFPEHLQDADLVTNFREFAFREGVPAPLAQKLMEWNTAQAVAQHQKMQEITEAARVAATDALKTEWGPQFEEKLAVAEEGLNGFRPEFRDFLKRTGLNNDPEMIRHLYDVALDRKADTRLKNGGDGGGAQTFEAKRDALMNHPAFKDPAHKEHGQVHKDLAALYAHKYPQEDKK